ncbi:ParA family protein [Halobium palmae]|uniref:ParA family protein n=1 Tax=Halobium palmae TaxID=1776492 RepID=A0ABD5RVA1_9EURY
MSNSSNTLRIALANQKGGAGKTSDTIHLGGALNAAGHDVLLVDIDYHGGLTTSLGYSDHYFHSEDDPDRTTLFDCFDFEKNEKINDIILQHDEFDIVPASEKLAANENTQQMLESPKSRQRLSSTLDALDKHYDYILIDTPPSLGILTDNALVAAQNIVIPVIPERLNANSLQILSEQLQGLDPVYGRINRLAIVANRVEKNKEHTETLERIREAYDIPLVEIPKRTDLSQSINEGVSIFGYQKENSRVLDARERFSELAEVVNDRIDALEATKA